jgi:hypothetical protein
MIIAIVGSRNAIVFFGQVMNAVDKMCDYDTPELIITGGAEGADAAAEEYAKTLSIPLLVFYPDYKNFGRRAPLVRNKEIVEKADAVIAFHDGSSKGTLHALGLAKKAGKKTMVVRV